MDLTVWTDLKSVHLDRKAAGYRRLVLTFEDGSMLSIYDPDGVIKIE